MYGCVKGGNNLKIKLKKRKLTVCIVGVGYVGQAIIKKILSKLVLQFFQSLI